MKPLLFVVLISGTLFGLLNSLPYSKRVEAEVISPRASTQQENYDIRADLSPAAVDKLRVLRGAANQDLRARASTNNSQFKIEHNDMLGIAEVISPSDANEKLAMPAGRSRASVLRDFIAANTSIFEVKALDQLHKAADYTNPDGDLSFVRLEQKIHGIPVFGAEVKAGFAREDEMFRVINSLAPGIDSESVSTDFGMPEAAVIYAATHIGAHITARDMIGKGSSRSNVAEFSAALFADAITAEKFYFPVGNGVARPAWRVLLSTNDAAYYVVVDNDGTLLWRKSITEDQVNPATFNVYGNLTSLMKTADSPSPFSPGCLAPTGCAQPPIIPRTNFTLVGNEAPYSFNNLGWIPDTGLPVRPAPNANITDGNNVEAGIDRDGTNGVDDNGWAFGNPTRVFSYTYNPAPGNPPPGEEPLPPGPQTYPPTAFQQGVVAHGFYLVNRWHDEMYRFGFTEQAQNFQHFNFGRGGAEGDRISFEIEDSSGTNGANFSTTADGIRPKLQMFIWTGPTPDRDGALDAHMVTHEITHGLTSRLHGNATGLNSNMSRGMGEGWSDFYTFALLSEPADDRLGTHALSGYAIYLLTPGFDANYYYGLRRFPVATWASRGPNGLLHNPLTWRYVNNICNTLIGTTTTNPNSAFPRGPIGTTTCDQIHNLGEIWAVTLWEVRDQLIERHGGAEGNRRALQYVTDGMKLSPLNPTVLQSRDAILAAVVVSDAADLGPVWRGFAIRGLGSSASIQNIGTGSNNTAVTESFALPPQYRRPTRADFDGDGRSDVSVFRPSDRNWYLNRSTAGFTAVTWGIATDKPLADDFDGDGKSDITVFRATADGSQPDYYILLSDTLTVSFVSWGVPGDIAVMEDFDGDNRSDSTIFRPSTGQFWVRRSTDGSVLISRPMPGSVPFTGDFDGDGRGDFGTFTDGTWLLIRSGNNYASGLIVNWGIAGDKVVSGDYDGDGKDDIAVFRPSDGTWYINNSAGGNRFVNFGLPSDVPAPADYDGDGRTDVAVYRSGTWYINASTSGVLITSFGLGGDLPLPASFIP